MFCPKLGEEQKEEKKLVQNLTRQPQLFRAPLARARVMGHWYKT